MAWQILTRKSQPHRKLFPVLRVKKKKKRKKERSLHYNVSWDKIYRKLRKENQALYHVPNGGRFKNNARILSARKWAQEMRIFSLARKKKTTTKQDTTRRISNQKSKKENKQIRLFLPERGHLTTRTCTNKINKANKHSLVARVSRTLVPCG